jgi:hypothetical protein
VGSGWCEVDDEIYVRVVENGLVGGGDRDIIPLRKGRRAGGRDIEYGQRPQLRMVRQRVAVVSGNKTAAYKGDVHFGARILCTPCASSGAVGEIPQVPRLQLC